jgi:hypothetical protein
VGAGDTGTEGDDDPTTGDGDGDPTTGDGDGDEDPDSDMDGIPDSSDNCPEIANPNQRDFDGNGIGNVCDVQVFSNVSGTLNSTVVAESRIHTCSVPIVLEVTSGEVRIQLDDDAELAAFEIVTLEIADSFGEECNLKVWLTGFSIETGGDFPVSIPHAASAHAGGWIAGDSNMQHPVLSTAILDAQVNAEPPVQGNLVGSTLPIFTANISNAGAMGILSWADAQFIVATETFVVDNMTNVDVQLHGLIGTVVMTP